MRGLVPGPVPHRSIVLPAVTVRVVIAVAAAFWLVLTSPGPATAAPHLPSPSSWPLPGTPAVVTGFDPPEQQWGSGHRGIDLIGTPGGPVLAAAGGTVTYAGPLVDRGVLVVDHGSVRTTYEPVTASVEVGTRVQAGQQIGTLDPGHCDPACLHFGLRQGERYLDPLLLAPEAADGSGHYRLLPPSEREAVADRAAARQAAPATISARQPGGSVAAGPAGSHGFRYPVAGPVTSPYGMRFHPVRHVYKLHDGTDFAAACGTPITAPYAGTVTERYYNAGYGNRLMIDHGVVDGVRVVSGFNHAIRYVVGIGQPVHAGQVIGYVGTTGFSTGCHLHLMTWLNGEVVDPMSWY